MRKLISAWVILLLLLPNFIFLVPVVPASALAPAPPTGQPLPPGTVTSHNTWNLSQTCQPSAPASQPLQSLPSWNATLLVPTLLFMGQSQGSFIRQEFALSPGGVFVVSDDRGNAFSLAVPVASGNPSTTTLVGNSTTAVEEIRVGTGPNPIADVKLSFSIYRQYCQPAGVRLEISGRVAWGSSGEGLLSIIFNHSALSSSKYRAYFGNTSGVALGFDAADVVGFVALGASVAQFYIDADSAYRSYAASCSTSGVC